MIETIMMRDKSSQLLIDIERLRALPAAELARTTEGQMLLDLSMRLDDVLRFRLEPLVDHIADARLDDRGETIRFLETQLAHDERRLAGQLEQAEAARRTLALDSNAQLPEALAASKETDPTPSDPAAVTPVVNET